MLKIRIHNPDCRDTYVTETRIYCLLWYMMIAVITYALIQLLWHMTLTHTILTHMIMTHMIAVMQYCYCADKDASKWIGEQFHPSSGAWSTRKNNLGYTLSRCSKTVPDCIDIWYWLHWHTRYWLHWHTRYWLHWDTRYWLHWHTRYWLHWHNSDCIDTHDSDCIDMWYDFTDTYDRYWWLWPYPDVANCSYTSLHKRVVELIPDVASDAIRQNGCQNQWNHCRPCYATDDWGKHNSTVCVCVKKRGGEGREREGGRGRREGERGGEGRMREMKVLYYKRREWGWEWHGVW